MNFPTILDSAADSQTDLLLYSPPFNGRSWLRCTPGQREGGPATSFDVTDVTRVVGHCFQLASTGEYHEQTVPIDRPAGAGFMVSTHIAQLRFFDSQTGAAVKGSLAELDIRAGIRGNELVCGLRWVRCAPEHALQLTLHASVLFFD